MRQRRGRPVLFELVAVVTLAASLVVAPLRAGAEIPPTIGINSSFDWHSTEWRYETVSPGGSHALEMSDGFDDSSWSAGQAGFGLRDGTCLYNDSNHVATTWPKRRELLLRRHFVIPYGASLVHLTATVDNHAKIYVNGAMLGDFTGLGCANASVSVDVPLSLLDIYNEVSIDASDDGTASYVDATITYDLAPSTRNPDKPTYGNKWAGYAALATAISTSTAAAQWIKKLDSTFIVPTVTCVLAKSEALIWAGLGGLNADAGPLYQIGISGDCATKNNPARYYAWWEYVPYPGSNQPCCKVSIQPFEATQAYPGDIILTTMDQTVLSNGKRQVFLGLTDIVPGSYRTRFSVSKTITKPLLNSEPYTAECVVETPSGGARTSLARFENASFTTCVTEAHGSDGGDYTWYPAGASSAPGFVTTGLEAVNAAGYELAYPTRLGLDGAGSFSVDWIRPK